MPLKRFIVFLLLIVSTNVFSQQESADLGLFAGGATPISDFTKLNLVGSIKPNFGGFYRYNFSSRYGVRVSAMYGKVGATGMIENLPWTFNKSVFQFETVVEINYLNFLLGVDKMKFSPFVYYGIGAMVYPGFMNTSVKLSPTIPIGIGAKYAINKKWGLSAEASIRKMFRDDLDNLDNPYKLNGLIQVSDVWHNNDWVCYYGVTVWYRVFWGKKPCPAYD